MSVWNERFQTLASDDLTDRTLPNTAEVFRPENVRLKDSNDGVFREENARLKKENEELRQCLVTMSENATRRTAHVLASLLVWSDEQLTGQANKFLSSDILNNNDTKLKSSSRVSPFRPISPGPIQQIRPINQQVPTGSKGNTHNSQINRNVSVPNPHGQHSSNLVHLDSHYTHSPSKEVKPSTPTPQHGDRKSAQYLKASGTSQKDTPRRYSPSNYTDDVPTVNVVPSSPSPANNRQISRSPVPPNKSPIPRNGPFSQPSISTGEARNKVLTPTTNRGSVQSYREKGNSKESPSFRNTKEVGADGISNQRYPDSASSIDDGLEYLLSRQIAPGEYTSKIAPGQGQYQSRFEMPGSSFSVGVGDRRVAVSGVLDQTRSEGYGSVPSSLGQFGGDQSERGYSDGIQYDLGVGQSAGSSVGAQSIPVSVASKAVGDPIATSTPVRPAMPGSTENAGPYTDSLEQSRSSQQQSDMASRVAAHSNVLHRPIDNVMGFKPTLTESRCQKLAKIKSSKRLIGEIAFQLDRRILEYVFSKKFVPDKENRKRYYGYSISNVGEMIRKEAMDEQGKVNVRKELEMRYRFDYIMKTLSSFGYILDRHSQFAQDMVNKHGLLNAPPDKQTVKVFGLEDPVILRVLLSKLLRSDVELQDELVLLDCLCLLAHDDRKPIFLW
ncbi:uncharacterized protein LOC132563888 [Ylistrum balloti]|uniref:uncharacterized protein LOC132563888 n=1 Tax=Ylistrum balloti TaxID=509963 RepID=UPI002905835D|nr:uncharacterized protein LOC132563888 [Ylistrum balloti]